MPLCQPPIVVVEPRYIDGAKLSQLLAGLFRRGEYAAEVSVALYRVARHFRRQQSTNMAAR